MKLSVAAGFFEKRTVPKMAKKSQKIGLYEFVRNFGRMFSEFGL